MHSNPNQYPQQPLPPPSYPYRQPQGYSQNQAPPPRVPQKWYRTNVGIVGLLILFFPIGLYVMWRYATWPRSAKWIVTAILAFFTVISGIANASTPPNAAPTTSAVQTSNTVNSQALPTQARTTQAKQAQPTTQPAPTKAPAAAQAPAPTAVPKPTSPPAPAPTQPPVHLGINNNPWGYNFDANGGHFITNPPTDFCTYFACIKTFWNGVGYVEECADTMYSLSGGIQGSCSRHGGDLRPLYSH